MFRFSLLSLSLAFAVACARPSPEPAAPILENRQIDVASVEPDAEMIAMLEPYAVEVAPLKAAIGRASVEMRSTRSDGALGSWVADIVRSAAAEATGSEIHGAFVNGGGIRQNLPEGEITSFTIMEILPFDNRLVVFEIDGARVDELAEALAGRWAYFPISGMRMTQENGAAKLLIGGEAVDSSKTYRIATVDYLATGGDNLALLKSFPAPHNTGVIIRDAAVAQIKKLTADNRTVDPPADANRYVKEEEQP